MKKRYCASLTAIIFIFLAVAAWGEKPKIFSARDVHWKVCGIRLGMAKKEVEQILGSPKRTDKHYEGAVGDVIEYWYDFGKVRFEPCDAENFDVASIAVDGTNASGPRNIKVGDGIETVLAKFPNDKNAPLESWGEENKIRYLYGKLGGNCGVIEYDKTGKPVSIRYYYKYFIFTLNIANGRVKSLACVAHNN